MRGPRGRRRIWGVLVEGFPNLLMVMGPHAGLGDFPRAAEYSVEWMTGINRNIVGQADPQDHALQQRLPHLSHARTAMRWRRMIIGSWRWIRG
jgi:hypothetical protein